MSISKTMTSLALAIGVSWSAVAAQATSLADAMVAAYDHIGLLEQNRATLRAADEDVAQAVSALRPVLSWSAQVQRNTSVSASGSTGFVSVNSASTTSTVALIASLTLYAGGANKLRVEAQKETVLATRASLLSVEQQVLLRAVNAFMEVQRAKASVDLFQNNVRVIRRELQAARDRFEVGEVTRTDVSLAEARLSGAQSNLASAQGSLQSAIEEYRAATGTRPRNLVSPRSLPSLPQDVEAAKAKAIRVHPDMLRAQRTVAASELGIEIARAAMRPTVTLSGRLTAQDTFDSEAYSESGQVTLGVEGPIYQGGRLSSLVRQSMAQRDEARGSLHVTRHTVAQNVGNAYVQLRVARANIAAFREQVRAQTQAFNGVREEATLGARTTLDVLDAEQELLDARNNLISAQVDEMVAAYTVLSALGELTAEKLGLNVTLYDPTEYYNLVETAPISRSRQGQQLDRVLKALGKE